jgi:ubiquinone/menaquinone biosynthesis C-methylase UbiE
MVAHEYLRDEQYADDRNLRSRQSLHQRFGTGSVRWFPWIFEQLSQWLVPNASVLEIGAGTGALWVQNRDRLGRISHLMVTDFSAGMLAVASRALGEHNIRARFAVMDAQALSLNDREFDVVIADHMLYHVPDRARALGEVARVLRPAGVLAAATNGVQNLVELDELISLFVDVDRSSAALSFTLENGAD